MSYLYTILFILLFSLSDVFCDRLLYSIKPCISIHRVLSFVYYSMYFSPFFYELNTNLIDIFNITYTNSITETVSGRRNYYFKAKENGIYNFSVMFSTEGVSSPVQIESRLIKKDGTVYYLGCNRKDVNSSNNYSAFSLNSIVYLQSGDQILVDDGDWLSGCNATFTITANKPMQFVRM